MVAVNELVLGKSWMTGSGGVDTFTIDGSSDKCAGIYRAHKTGTIDRVGVHAFVVTGSPELEIRIETVSSAGAPTGTLFGTTTSVNYSPTTDGWTQLSLTTAASVTAGDVFAVVIAVRSGGQIGASHNATMTFGVGSVISASFPYSWTDDGVTPTLRNKWPIPVARYDSGGGDEYVYGGFQLVSANTNLTFNVDTGANDEIGCAFTAPVGLSVIGAILQCAFASASSAAEVVLYDGTTAQRTVVMPAGQQSQTSMGGRVVQFSSAFVLSASSVYRIVLKPTTTNNVALVQVTYESVAARQRAIGDLYKTRRVDAGSWTDETTVGISVFPVFSDIPSGGGGGMLVHPGMVAGMRG